jgi:hypothetical protein
MRTHPHQAYDPRRVAWRSRLIAVLAYWVTCSAFAVAPLVNATLEPKQIAVGDSAQLTITSSGDGIDQISLPQVAGLEFRVVGKSRRIEIVNGATFDSTTILIRVTAEAPGIFTIPGITPQSQPLVLRVNPDNGAGGSPSSGYNSGGFNSSGAPPISAGGTTSNGIRLTADGSAFIRLNLPKREVYVGESIPVDIEVGMRAGVVTSLNGLPALTGGEFTLNNLSRQPERVERVIDGKPFTLLTWHSVLAPVKPGTFTLSVSSPITIRVRTRPQKDSLIDDLLGDPFLQNVFGATIPKDITITSPQTDLTVLALPTEGRPADFSGAVGTFKISNDLSAATAAVGDPLTLKMRVTGTGNFDRVDSPMLEHVDEWKTYPPKSTFTPGDSIGYKGEKTFEQPLIATHPGAQTVPGLTFSYFDPNTRKYETARSAPLNVTISPALADTLTAAQPPGPSTTAAPAAPTPAAARATPGMRPDHAVTDAYADALQPLYLRRDFLMVPSLLTLALAGAWLALHRRAMPQRAPARRVRITGAWASRVLQRMEAAANTGDSVLFFNTARAALQQKLATRWAMNADEVTTLAVSERLMQQTDREGARDGETDVRGEADRHGEGEGRASDPEILRLFTLADEANYAGGVLNPDFAHWSQVVRDELSEEVLA